jgi:pimeloyl-ACP methyl ester carboxylesterase
MALEVSPRRHARNRASLAIYAVTAMAAPGLAGRLADIKVPTLVVWGEADRIADPDYGRAYAAAIPGARFLLLTGTGHLPQIETPSSCARRSGTSPSAGTPGPDLLAARQRGCRIRQNVLTAR